MIKIKYARIPTTQETIELTTLPIRPPMSTFGIILVTMQNGPNEHPPPLCAVVETGGGRWSGLMKFLIISAMPLAPLTAILLIPPRLGAAPCNKSLAYCGAGW